MSSNYSDIKKLFLSGENDRNTSSTDNSSTTSFDMSRIREIKDGMFRLIMREREYKESILNDLFDYSIVDSNSNIIDCTIQDSTMKGIRNDCSLLIDNVVISFIEVESKSLSNICLKLLKYCAELLHRISLGSYGERPKNRYGTVLPRPVFIALCTNPSVNYDYMVSMDNCFTEQVFPYSLSLNVKVIQYKDLVNMSNILREYFMFCVEQIKLYKEFKKDIVAYRQSLINWCSNNTIYLHSILLKYFEEAKVMFDGMYFEQLKLKEEKEESFQEGRQKGKQENYDELITKIQEKFRCSKNEAVNKLNELLT